MEKNLYKILLTEGIFFALLGVLILTIPKIISIWTILLISLALVIGGIYKLINSIALRKELDNPWIAAMTGVLSILGGVYIQLNPYFSLIIFTTIISIYLILDGIYSILIATHTRKLSKIWISGIIGGILQFMLAFLIIFGMPQISFAILGILIGVNMLIGGSGLIILALNFHKIINPN